MRAEKEREKKKPQEFRKLDGYLRGTLCLSPVNEDLYLNQWTTQ